MKKDVCHKNLVSRAVDVWKTEGSAAVYRKTGARLKNIVFRSNSAGWFASQLVVSSPLEQERARDETGAAAVAGEFSLVAPHELAEWLIGRTDLAWAADPREMEIAASFKHTWTCWRSGGETTAFCKVASGRVFVVDFERSIWLPDTLAFLSDVYVLPHARRKGVGRRLLLATLDHLGRNSFSVVSCHIPSSNRPSTKLFESLGFHFFGEISFVRVLGFSVFSTRPETMLKKMVTAGRPGAGRPGGRKPGVPGASVT